MLSSSKTTHRSLLPFFSFSRSTTSEGTVIRLRDPLIVIAVSFMHFTVSNSIFGIDQMVFNKGINSLLFLQYILNMVVRKVSEVQAGYVHRFSDRKMHSTTTLDKY